ncbi:MAG: beta-propeller fold lactonase family protein [Terriglobales bacterium]
MSKKIGGVIALVGMCALSVFLVNCGNSSTRPAGVVYVLTQGTTGIGNNVTSFAMNLANGNLTEINDNASTCPTTATLTNPEPCGIPIDILLDPLGATGFVLNQGIPCPEVLQNGVYVCGTVPGSNPPVAAVPVPPTIYPYVTYEDGSLSSPGTPAIWTCPSNPTSCTYSDSALNMTRDAAGQFLFVISHGSYPSPGYPEPTLTNPSCPHAPSGQHPETDVCPSISVYSIKPGSTTMTLASGSPFYLSKIPSGLATITFTPPTATAPQEFLYVSNNLDICTQNCVLPQHSDNTVSAYTVSSSGTLTEQPYSPYVVAAVNPVSVMPVYTNLPGTNSGGLYVYVGNSSPSGGGVNPFYVCTVQNPICPLEQDVQNNLMTPLVQVCGTPPCNPVPPTSVGSNPLQMLADPTNNFLYVLSEGSNQVFAFRISPSAGTLTALAPPNQPTGSQPVSMAIHAAVNVQGQPLYQSSGQFLYTSNTTASSISGFSINATNGSMSSPLSVISPAAPSGIAVH